MITEADIKKFAPKAKKEYVAALLSGIDDLRDAGILESPYRLCHFMAQVGHETGGLTITRESLHYSSAKRLREVWPSRFRNKSDDDLRPLLKNGIALGDAVYMGRMGNNLPGDGYAYRGGYWLQTTGKEAVETYAKAVGVTPSASLLDDIDMTLRFACLEWKQSNCCEYADENDITKVSKAINVGSVTSNVKPVDLSSRQAWFAKAWSVWGDKGKPDRPIVSDDLKDTAKAILTKVAGGAAVVGTGGTVALKPADQSRPQVAAPPVKLDAKTAIAKGKETREIIEQAKDLGIFAREMGKWAAGDGMFVAGGIGAAALIAWWWSKK